MVIFGRKYPTKGSPFYMSDNSTKKAAKDMFLRNENFFASSIECSCNFFLKMRKCSKGEHPHESSSDLFKSDRKAKAKVLR